MSGATETLAQQLAWLLLGAALVGMLAGRLRIPYAVALVLGGLIVSELHIAELPRLEPDLLLFIFLPPLLFDASFRLDHREARAVLPPMLLLAVPGVLVTALLVGAALALLLGLPLPVGLLLGSLVAATDPVAVTGVFRELHVSRRLEALAEGESLINDGMAITLYTALIGLALTGATNIGQTAVFFLQQVLGGVLIGTALGFGVSRLNRAVDNHLVEMTLSTALAYGSFLFADALHTSGALACVAAGVVHGSYGRQVGMSEDTRQRLDDLWEYLGFLANALVFLLVGLSVHLDSLLANAWPVLVAIVAVVVSRVPVLWGSALFVRNRSASLSQPERVVLLWGGLRGALTIALALALPPETPSRDLLIVMAFGVVLFTLVVQGTTLPLVIRWAGLGRAA